KVAYISFRKKLNPRNFYRPLQMRSMWSCPRRIAKEDNSTFLQISIDQNIEDTRDPFLFDVLDHVIEDDKVILLIDRMLNNILYIKHHSRHTIFSHQWAGNSDMIGSKIKRVTPCT